MKLNSLYWLAFVIAGCLLFGCQSTSRYQLAQDVAPTRTPTDEEMINPIPRYQPPSRGGNKTNYTVRGKTYSVMPNAIDFEQEGIASWYGRKFHGHLTSNGERYNMFAMSAAHKNLPLPTYLEVTNLSNGKTAIVRVNDRGPFHQDRIIDLSYSAAYKLGITATGTSRVKLKALATVPGGFILVDEAESEDKLNSTSIALSMLYQISSKVIKKSETYQLIAGPIQDEDRLQQLIEQLISNGYRAQRYQDVNLTDSEPETP